jgi:hypothetical protein
MGRGRSRRLSPDPQRLPVCLGALASRSLDSTQVCGKSSGHCPSRLIAQEGSYRLEVGYQLRPWCVRELVCGSAFRRLVQPGKQYMTVELTPQHRNCRVSRLIGQGLVL